LKITDVKTIVTCPRRNYVIVKILTDEGTYGLGDATLNGRELAVAEALRKHIAPLLIGKNPDRIEDIWQYIFRGTYWRGGPVLMTALSGVDMALWDIKGKRAGLPVYSLLGGKTREKVRVYMHVHGKDFEEALEKCRGLIKTGCTALRVSVDMPDLPPGRWEPKRYLAILPKFISYLRDNLGDDVDLLHDVHERVNPIQACQLARELEPYKMFFLEDPVRPEYKETFRLIRQHTSIPLAMGELYFTKWDCLPLITEQLIDFIRVDLVHVGGITEAKKIAAIAEPYYVETAFHGPGDISPIAHAANVHVDMSIPNFGIQEFVDLEKTFPQIKEVFKGGPEYKNGHVTVKEEPGLGVDIDEDAAEKYPYKQSFLPTLRRLDGSVTDW